MLDLHDASDWNVAVDRTVVVWAGLATDDGVLPGQSRALKHGKQELERRVSWAVSWAVDFSMFSKSLILLVSPAGIEPATL